MVTGASPPPAGPVVQGARAVAPGGRAPAGRRHDVPADGANRDGSARPIGVSVRRAVVGAGPRGVGTRASGRGSPAVASLLIAIAGSEERLDSQGHRDDATRDLARVRDRYGGIDS